ncbi:iron-containing alcohol dehydrogenase [Clostridium rectalis]|uniref:iron-containing alcohol dehydrogenase n=1 Tax=Clostridium rectalis TaxID=2040295 RepID=UPI000F63067D|nr:iron-containing alcohol dehydrogenase [Clostridium rectalis]
MKNLIFGGKKIVTGINSIEYLKNFKEERVFIVTGAGSMVKTGVVAKIEKILKAIRCQVYLYSGVKKNPDKEDVTQGIKKMQEFKPSIIIGLGGGSAMDAAKVMSILYENKYINFNNILSLELPKKRKKIKLIFIPSTSGTASEVTKSAVITFKEKNLKIGFKTEAFIPDLAILDANLTMTMPDNIVAETGMDALTHAVECYINEKSDDFTDVMAIGAIEGIIKYLPISYVQKTLESREKMHNFQCLAGLAFANVGLGMAHGISHAVGGKFNLGHGLINAIVLPYVLNFNCRNIKVKEKLSKLAIRLGKDDFIEEVMSLNSLLNIPKSLSELGVDKNDFYGNFELIVENSLKGSTKVNPVKPLKGEMEMLLKSIWKGDI